MTCKVSSSRISGSIKAGLIAVGFLILLPAWAKQGDRNQPIHSEQDSISGFYAPNSITTLTGHVVVTQGTMKVTGDLAKLYMDESQHVSRIVVTGNPAHIEQLDDNDRLMTGDAMQLDYDDANGIAVLTGDAVVHQQGRGEAHADKVTYNTQTEYAVGVGNVHMIMLPKSYSRAVLSPVTSGADVAPRSATITIPAKGAASATKP